MRKRKRESQINVYGQGPNNSMPDWNTAIVTDPKMVSKSRLSII